MAQWVESTCSAGDVGSIPGSGRCPGEENGNPLQYSCMQNPMDRGSWQATPCKVSQSWTQLSKHNKKKVYILHGYSFREYFAPKGQKRFLIFIMF